MATQGIVAIVLNEQMFFKAVAGSNGGNAHALAAWARKHQGVMTIADVYKAAQSVGFGSDSDLVVQSSDGSFAYDGDAICEEDLGPLYRDYEKFLNPTFNPRWEQGLADYVEVIHVS